MFFIHEEKQIYSLVNKKCPRPATTDPNEPYNIESRAQGMFSTSKIPRSLKGQEKQKIILSKIYFRMVWERLKTNHPALVSNMNESKMETLRI